MSTSERDIRFCRKRKQKFLATSNDADYKKIYKDELDKQVPLVKINYGPYEANGITKHRPQKLYGVVGKLFLRTLKNDN